MNSEQLLKDLTQHLCIALVEDPASLTVHASHGSDSPTFKVRIEPQEMGMLIGKKGRIANAIRSIVKSTAKKHGTNCYVEIAENGE